MINKIALIIITLCISNISAAETDYRPELEKLTTSNLNVIESSLIVELKERTGAEYEKTEISRFAYSKKKKESDRKNLINSIVILISKKLDVQSRVELREENPSFNDKSVITPSEILIKKESEKEYKKGISIPVLVLRGDIVKNKILIPGEEFEVEYRVSYSENGEIKINGKEKSKYNTFDVNSNGIKYNVKGSFHTSFSGWGS